MGNRNVPDIAASLLTLLLGGYCACKGYGYGLIKNGITGPGFVPFWIGVALMGASLLVLLPALKVRERTDEAPFALDAFKPVLLYAGSSIVVLLLTPFLGLILPTGVMVGATAKIRGVNLRESVILGAATAVVLFLLFKVALKVPLPTNALGF